MAYKRLDIDEDATYDGFSFVDDSAVIYFASNPEEVYDETFVSFGSEGCPAIEIFTKDIPMMIKILQAAYDMENSI